MGKYSPLAQWLSNTSDEVTTLSLEDVERIVGFTLPESARRYQAFWAGSAVNPELKRVGWHAYPRLAKSTIIFRRDGHLDAAPIKALPQEGRADVILLGCVKSKREGRWPARSLYVSPLFAGRVKYAESTGKPWCVLSAKHGVVTPDEEIDNYDVSLVTATAAEREAWAHVVLATLDSKWGSLRGKVVEVHAGEEYRAPALLKGIRDRGGSVSVPLRGLRLGEQLAWYANHATPTSGGSERERAEEKALRTSSSELTATDDSRQVEQTDSVAHVARQLSQEFMDGEFDLSARSKAPLPTWDSMPEFVAARTLQAVGASPLQLRVFLTFMAAMDRARDADRLWLKGADLYRTTPWAFDASAIIARSLGELGDVLSRSGVSQRHGPDAAAWRTIAESLRDERSPASVRSAVFDGVGYAPELLGAIRAMDNRRTWYPFLAGPKISQMWVRMLAVPGGATINGLEHLDVAVDTQVRKVTEYLGVTETAGGQLDEIRPVIQKAWKIQADDVVAPGPLAKTSAGLDPALWFMGKWGCTFCERAARKMPISRACIACRLPRIRALRPGGT